MRQVPNEVTPPSLHGPHIILTHRLYPNMLLTSVSDNMLMLTNTYMIKFRRPFWYLRPHPRAILKVSANNVIPPQTSHPGHPAAARVLPKCVAPLVLIPGQWKKVLPVLAVLYSLSFSWKTTLKSANKKSPKRWNLNFWFFDRTPERR